MLKVYLVEDSALLRDRLVKTFSQLEGVEICGYADSAEQAIEKIKSAKPDVVVLDIRLHQGNGLQVLQVLKLPPQPTPGTPPIVIVLTNFAYPQYREKFTKAGADYFFDKSSDFMRVTGVLQELANAKRAQDKARKKKSAPGQAQLLR